MSWDAQIIDTVVEWLVLLVILGSFAMPIVALLCLIWACRNYDDF